MANPQLQPFLKPAEGDRALLQHWAVCATLDVFAVLEASMGCVVRAVDRMRQQAEATRRFSEQELAVAAGVELEGHLWRLLNVWG